MEGGMARASGSPGKRPDSHPLYAQHLVAAALKLVAYRFDGYPVPVPFQPLTDGNQVL